MLTRSAEDSLLTFDENGGVKEVPITGDRVVLTDEVIRRLVRAAVAIKRVFGDRDQDIEWAYMKGPDLHRSIASVHSGKLRETLAARRKGGSCSSAAIEFGTLLVHILCYRTDLSES